MKNNNVNNVKAKKTTTNRDKAGRFRPGHSVGRATRFKPGQSSPNPSGRPWGVRKWLRVLRSRRYHRPELEEIVADDQAHLNQREAAVCLLLPQIEQSPPIPQNLKVIRQKQAQLERVPTADLRWVTADPREPPDRRAAAFEILASRGVLKPPHTTRQWRCGVQQLSEFERQAAKLFRQSATSRRFNVDR